MVQLTCYGGVGQVGGNQVLLEDGETRLFFDFGIPFGERSRFFEEYLNPRPGAGLLDVMEMGLLPPLQGLYRSDLTPTGRFWERIESSADRRAPLRRLEEVAGVLVSHAHVDHNGYISFLREDIPIFSTAMTGIIAKAMQDSGQSSFERETAYVVPREDSDGVLRTIDYRRAPAQQRPYGFFDLERQSSEVLDFWGKTPGSRQLHGVPPEGVERIGRLPVRSFPVDHSIYGAAAYAVETSAGWIIYTGDLRLQGGRAEGTRRFIEEAARLRPRALVCEGTRLTGEGAGPAAVSEEQVRQNALRAVRDASGLVIADFGPRNIERLRAFLAIAQETGRQLVVLDKDAYLLEAMHLVDPQVPSVEAVPNLLVYQDLRSGLDRWQRDLRERLAHRFIGPAQVAAHLGDFILSFSFFDIKNLIDINPDGGLYLYSSSEAYNEEQEMDLRRLHEWLRHFSLRPLGLPAETPDEQGRSTWSVPEPERGLHASGHATGEEIIAMVREIAPQAVVPVHTEYPELFVERLRGSGIEVRVPKYGVPVEFD